MEEMKNDRSADKTNFDIKLERRPDAVGRDCRCCLTRGKRQARAVAKGKSARSRMGNEGARLFSLRCVKIDDVNGGNPQRCAGGVQRGSPLDKFRDDFGVIDARHDRITDEPRDNVSPRLSVNEGEQCRTVENDTAHSSISRAASRRRSAISSSTRLTFSGTNCRTMA